MQKYLIFILLIFVVVWRFVATRPDYNDGQKLRITTKVTTEPIRYSNSQYLHVVGLRFYLDPFPEVNYGDEVVVEGVVKGNKLEDAKLIKVTPTRGLLYKIRAKLVKFYKSSLPEPHSSLVAGVVIGSKQSIPKPFWEVLKKTGTAHVVVASGMNVTLVAGFLMNVLILFIPRRRAVVIALMGVWTYALLAGFDAPIIRAAIMGSIGFTAIALGRLNYAWRGLFISALVMLLINPSWLTDLGFVLSFVATASLMLFEKRIRVRIKRVPKVFKEGLSTSLAAQVGVAPILFVTFGQFSLLSPIVNALVLWTIAPITIIGMIAGMLGLVFSYIGTGVLYLVYPLTSWFIGIVRLFS